MRDLISLIQVRFPNHHDRVARCLAGDPEFFSICQDYRTCLEAHRHWVCSTAAEADERVKEYQSLIDELENEISAVLQCSSVH